MRALLHGESQGGQFGDATGHAREPARQEDRLGPTATEARASRTGVSRGVRRRGARSTIVSNGSPKPFARRAPRSCAAGLLCLAAALAGCVTVEIPIGGRRRPLVETVIEGTSGPKIALLEIDGVISERDEPGPLGVGGRESSVARVREVLEKAKSDPEVRALVVRIDSPGGTVTASDVIHHELLRFKQETGRPVIAQMMGVAASGGYYVAMASDRVLAHPTTITGSIGVVFAGVNVSGLFEKLGVADQTLVAGERKDTGSPLRPMRPEERAQLQGVLDDLHARFRSVVQAGRPALDAERVRALADGRIYTATQALDAGLVDAIGYLPDAIGAAAQRAGISSWRVVTYARPSRPAENVYSPAAAATAAQPLVQLDWPGRSVLASGGPGFLYLWMPGQ